MSRGRCICGFENVSCRVVRTHMGRCDVATGALRSDPERVLDPEEEYARHRAWLRSPEGRAAREQEQEDRRTARRADAERRTRRALARWDG